jgi:hypothetical protein
VKRSFEIQGFEVTPSTPEALHDFMVSEVKKYREVLKSAGIAPQ